MCNGRIKGLKFNWPIGPLGFSVLVKPWLRGLCGRGHGA